MAFVLTNQGLMHLAAIEKAGNTPDVDISNRWSYRTMSNSEKYMVGVGIFMDITAIIIVFFSTFCNLSGELRAFFHDPTDRLVIAGGYEHEERAPSEVTDEEFTFKKMWAKIVAIGDSKATVPNVYYNRIMHKYDQMTIDRDFTFADWYTVVSAHSKAITSGLIMAGLETSNALEYSTDVANMMTGASGFVGAILGDSAQTAAIMRTDMGDLVRNYVDHGGQMQTAQVVSLLKDLKRQGLSNEEMLKKMKDHARAEKKRGYKSKTKYEGAARAAKRRRVDRKRRRRATRVLHEQMHRRPTMSRKSFLKRGQAKKRTKSLTRGGPSRRRRQKTVRGISVFMR